ncbi:MAG: ferritin-like domain-containing protein [Deltaproteobacteria bacterium]|nr:ferritin-like domain-containing protein [Deltaproteobacteria bacterium]
MWDHTDQFSILNLYRAAEVQGAELLERLLRRVSEPEMTLHLTHQLADEARHIQLITELIQELGGSPTVIRRRALPIRGGYAGPETTLELLALLRVTEGRLQQRYREHAAQRDEDRRVVAALQALASDEEWHLAGVKALLATQEKQFGRTRVGATLDYYWDLARHG